MFYVYVIQSLMDKSLYKGHCQNISQRLKQYNSGATKSIKSKVPFKLMYSEEYEHLMDAIKREKYFKTAAGRKFIKSKIDL